MIGAARAPRGAPRPPAGVGRLRCGGGPAGVFARSGRIVRDSPRSDRLVIAESSRSGDNGWVQRTRRTFRAKIQRPHRGECRVRASPPPPPLLCSPYTPPHANYRDWTAGFRRFPARCSTRAQVVPLPSAPGTTSHPELIDRHLFSDRPQPPPCSPRPSCQRPAPPIYLLFRAALAARCRQL